MLPLPGNLEANAPFAVLPDFVLPFHLSPSLDFPSRESLALSQQSPERKNDGFA
jgi:hypothetical protein